MTVKELIKLLETMPENMECVLACDDEGNYFRSIPSGWVSKEFMNDGEIIHPDDMDEYQGVDLEEKVIIG